jgi:hypothetical protein
MILRKWCLNRALHNDRLPYHAKNFKRRESIVRFIATFFFAVMLLQPVYAEGPSPENATHTFYTWVLAHPEVGLPSATERASLASMLSPALIKLLTAASDTEDRCIKNATKGDKPHVMEGSLFLGVYEGATDVAYGTPYRRADTAFVTVDLIYVDTRFAKGHKHRVSIWKDRLALRSIDHRWLVDDIKLRQKRLLTSVLKDYIADGVRWCGKP